MIQKLSVLEIFLIQVVVYTSIWLWDEYVASYISIIFPIVFLTVFIVSLIAEWIEPSKISRKYYLLMLISILTPAFVGLSFYLLFGGNLNWLEGF
jgi:hypothetical protein